MTSLPAISSAIVCFRLISTTGTWHLLLITLWISVNVGLWRSQYILRSWKSVHGVRTLLLFFIYHLLTSYLHYSSLASTCPLHLPLPSHHPTYFTGTSGLESKFQTPKSSALPVQHPLMIDTDIDTKAPRSKPSSARNEFNPYNPTLLEPRGNVIIRWK